MKWNCYIRSVNPRDLSENQFLRLNEVSQDMWAESLWELVQCKCCGKMMSKQDIFWHLAKEVYDETVQKIMELLWITQISCVECGSETRFVYWEEHLGVIKDRLLWCKKPFLVIAENQQWEIVWYEEWYIDTLDNIFRREFIYHYGDIWFMEIKRRVWNVLLWEVPNEMLVLSSIWLLSKYINFFTLFEILKTFANTISDWYIDTPWITEVDKKNNLNKISQAIWSISLWFHEDMRSKISNTWKDYESNLILIPEAWRRYRHFTSKWIKNLIKITRN